jgi:CubicO group peptidase (beta-lactamase class C family)
MTAAVVSLVVFSASAQTNSALSSSVSWAVSTPAAEGMNPKPIDDMLAWMRSSGMGFHAVILIRNDKLAVETYFPPFSRDSRQDVFSCAKSVLSTLFGIAAAEGRLPPLDRSALSCLTGAREVRDPRSRDITIEQLLTMKSGIPLIRAVDLARVSDQVSYILGKPLAADPGAGFMYTSAGPQLLSAVLQAAVGMSANEYAARKLFAPLGITGWSWDSDGMGVTVGGAALSLTAVDCAKIGYLYLRKGDWYGTRVVPASWVEAATRSYAKPAMNRAEDSGYGYLWWIDAQWEGYSAHGAGGQFIFVIPRLDLVAVFTSELPTDSFPIPWDLMTRYVLPAFSENR